MLCFKLFHAVNQRLHALKRLSVVAAGTEAANRAVALDADHALGCGKLEERLLKLSILVVHDEADVHARTILLCDGTTEQAVAVDLSVKDVSTLDLSLIHI